MPPFLYFLFPTTKYLAHFHIINAFFANRLRKFKVFFEII